MRCNAKLLAIDTSSVACTVAASNGDAVVERHVEQPREHTRLLMPMIREVLNESEIALTDLDAIVLGNGPGSFIGMRIAASVSQGLAHGAGLKIIPVSSLAAVAAEVLDASDAELVAVAQDAHMNEVYLGLYSRGEDNLPQPITNEYLQGQSVIESLSGRDQAFTIAGQGWQRYPELAIINAQWIGEQSEVFYPRAAWLLTLSDIATAIEPRDIQPAYLRQKVAELPRMRAS
ncbi:MAG: tRNA (adenosine(37)-N6)-threonylcarbamoyltransferase complex dimerization subunit type 1 TsaB [Gammaproteobacteria bacterium]|jgi:tRNA threonylcarbamoyladenosine biosynthesis protein TsaB|nr:tRNA (adenosine(37)-N6)-threonylcarbamoyltransferase complex dimerization subunit type 1 TsaB [Gammaproteobacteria bacterium]